MEAADIVRRLESRYSPPEWATFAELPDGTGSAHCRTIDLFAQNCYPSKRFLSVAVEVKVTRADFRRELENPGKRLVWERQANEFWFAAPKGVVPVEELPEGAGLLEAWGDKLRAKRRAVQRMENFPKHNLMISMARASAEARDRAQRGDADYAEFRGKSVGIADLRRLARKLWDGHLWKIRDEIEAEMRQDRRKLYKAHPPAAAWQSLASLFSNLLRDEFGEGRYSYEATPRDAAKWLAAQGSLIRVREAARMLRETADEIEGALK